MKLYKKVKKNGHKFEIVFISSDRSEESFKQFFSNMPWLAVPYSEEKCRKELQHLYTVGGNAVVLFFHVSFIKYWSKSV